MKNGNPLNKLTLLVAVLLTLGVAPAQSDIIPAARISFAPVGITMDQTAQLNFVNLGVPNGMLIHWRFIDANGLTLAQSTLALPLGQIVSVDFSRQSGTFRAEVRAQVDILSDGIESLRRSLEVFNNDTGATTVFMGNAIP